MEDGLHKFQISFSSLVFYTGFMLWNLHPYPAEKLWAGQLKCSSLALLWVSVSNFMDSKLDLLLWPMKIIVFENNFVAPQFLSTWRQSLFCPDCGLVLCGVFPTVALEGFKHIWLEALTQLTYVFKPFSLVHLSANLSVFCKACNTTVAFFLYKDIFSYWYRAIKSVMPPSDGKIIICV